MNASFLTGIAAALKGGLQGYQTAQTQQRQAALDELARKREEDNAIFHQTVQARMLKSAELQAQARADAEARRREYDQTRKDNEAFRQFTRPADIPGLNITPDAREQVNELGMLYPKAPNGTRLDEPTVPADVEGSVPEDDSKPDWSAGTFDVPAPLGQGVKALDTAKGKFLSLSGDKSAMTKSELVDERGKILEPFKSVKPPTQPKPTGPTKPLGLKDLHGMRKDFIDRTEASLKSRSPFAVNQSKLNMMDRIMSELDNPNIVQTVQKIHEYGQDLAGLIAASGNGGTSDARAAALTPQFVEMKLREWQQKFQGKPIDAGARAFIDQWKEEMNSAARVIDEENAKTVAGVVHGFKELRDADPEWVRDQVTNVPGVENYIDLKTFKPKAVRRALGKPSGPTGPAASLVTPEAPKVTDVQRKQILGALQPGERAFIVNGRAVAIGPNEQPPAGAVEVK